MLYIIGLGLNGKAVSLEALEAIKKCKKAYLDSYTVNFPYSVDKLEKTIKKKVIKADREAVESNKILKETKKEDICLLVYGSPLTATTHISLIQEAEKSKIKYEIIYNASVLDAIAETGLQIYKFGKITSMPKWKKSYEPKSFIEIVKQNQSIEAHSLILIDIGLELKDAINELKISAEEYNLKLNKIVICSELGTKNKKIFYSTIENLNNKKVKMPYCIIIPSKLHFMESEMLRKWE
jgi:diphthine synthase